MIEDDHLACDGWPNCDMEPDLCSYNGHQSQLIGHKDSPDGILPKNPEAPRGGPCSKCGSSDALHTFPDHTWCFSCKTLDSNKLGKKKKKKEKKDKSGKAWKVYSIKTDRFMRHKNMQGLVFERSSAAKRLRTNFIKKYNLPKDSLEIVEYKLVEIRRYKHDEIKDL
jgi:hypothetical protein